MNVKKNMHLSSGGGQHVLQPIYPTGVAPPSSGVLEEKDYGTETEGEKQMKLMLEKQLKVNMTLKEHESRHREFTKSSTYTSMTEMIQGACTLEKYKEVEQSEEDRMALQQCGLSEDEIRLYLGQKSTSLLNTEKPFAVEPSVLEKRLQEVQKKIRTHENQLHAPDAVSGAKAISRHAMDIEKTLYAGCAGKKRLDHLITHTETKTLDKSDPFKHIKDLSEKLIQNVHKRRKKRKRDDVKDQADRMVSDEDGEKFVYDSNIHHVIVPLDDNEITAKKLTIEEIRKIPRFEKYTPGDPSKVLYLKNLHPKVNLRELQAIFGRFQGSDADCINYNLLSGKMRGQAFLTFQDVQIAKEAVECVNGFMLRKRPIIIEFGKTK